jgi:hypothetical protein
LDILPKFNNDKFIVYHHRFKNEGFWDQSEEMINKMLEYNKKYKIIIFTQAKINNINENIYITNNLKEYASYIHSENCIAVISVWSGGGQMASFCCNKNTKLIMYFDKVQLQYNDSNNNNLDKWIVSPNAFDFAQFTDVKRFFIKQEEIDFDKGIIERLINS